jgi:Transposase DDE domain
VNQQDCEATRLFEYIAAILPWAHGHQLKAITTYVAQIMEKQTGCQAQLARGLGNQEAACKRLSRLLHNQRLKPKDLAQAVLWWVVSQLPGRGPVRVAVDWTSEDTQHLLVVSLILGWRAIPVYWRAYDASVLKGRMQRYELAVVRRALGALARAVGAHRLIVTADRGFADVKLFTLLEELKVRFFIRVKGNTKVLHHGHWRKLNSLGFQGNTRRYNLGSVAYCESSPQTLFVTLSRQRDRQGKWGVWYVVSNREERAGVAAAEYAHRFGCEEGFRDAKWWLGFKRAHIQQITAWSRLFALFVIALLAITSLGLKLLRSQERSTAALLRRVSSRRHRRRELSLVSAMLSLLQEDKSLLNHLTPNIKLCCEAL